MPQQPYGLRAGRDDPVNIWLTNVENYRKILEVSNLQFIQ